MATRYGILAQAAPAAGVLTDLYLVPRQQSVREVRVIACNRGLLAAVRIAVAPKGEAIADEQYIAFDKPVADYETASSVELILGEGHLVRVQSDTGDVSFILDGIESTVR